MSKVILHIDLNKFFVRCAEIKNPSLIGKPVAIGGEGRGGIVSTCSYEARKYGVTSGMPMFKAKELCPYLIIEDVDFKFIELMSREFINHVKNYSNIIEQLSCDECYCDITENSKKPNFNIIEYLKEFQNSLFKKTKLYSSIGVGPTKFLAKMGSDYKKPLGITIIRKKDIKKLLFPLKVLNFYGIGKKTALNLNDLGIYTIGQLYDAIKENKEEVISLLGGFSKIIIDNLEGNSDDTLNDFVPQSKSIGTSSTLPYDTDDKTVILKIYVDQVNRIVDKMKKENYLTKTMQLTIKDASYDGKFKTFTYSNTIDSLTDNKEKILKNAIKLFENSYKGEKIRLIGFSLKNLIYKTEKHIQMTFDDYEIHENENKTGLLINKLNREFNKEVFKKVSDLKK